MKVSSVRFNAIMNFILTASGILFPLLTFPYISRVLLVEGNGKIAFATSVGSYFLLLSSLGIPTYGIRACARVRDNKDKLSKLVQEILFINIITTIISFLLFIGLIYTVPSLAQEKELMFINAITMVINIFGVNWLYSALEQYSYITIRSLVFKVISIVLMFAFVKEPKDYILYAGICAFAAVGANVLNFINLRKYVYVKLYQDYKIMGHLKPIFVFFAQSLASSIYTNLDVVMLGLICGNVQVGYYTAATKIKAILLTLVLSLGTVLLPRLSYYINQNKEKQFISLVKKAFEVVLILSLSLSVYVVMFAPELILFLSGTEFLGAAPAMKIITPTLFFIGITNLLGIQILTPMCKEKYVLISVTGGAIVNLILNYSLIPSYGAVGAAIATLVAEIVVLIIQLFYTFDIVKKVWHLLYKDCFKIIIATIGSCLVGILVQQIKIENLILEILVSGTAFYVCFAFTLIILKETFVMGLYKEFKNEMVRIQNKILSRWEK